MCSEFPTIRRHTLEEEQEKKKNAIIYNYDVRRSPNNYAQRSYLFPQIKIELLASHGHILKANKLNAHCLIMLRRKKLKPTLLVGGISNLPEVGPIVSLHPFVQTRL